MIIGSTPRRSVLALACAVGLVLGTPGPASARESPAPAACPDSLPVLVPRPYAESAGLSAGDPLRLSTRAGATGCPGRVSGVYRLPADPYRVARDRPRILLHLAHLAALTGREGEVDRFTVELREGVSPDSAGPVLEALMPGTRALGTEEVAARTSTTFRVVERFHRAIGLITVAAGGVFLACVMVLKVGERRREVAALRLIGISRGTLLAWILTEAALVALVGGAAGLGLGRAASWAINAHYRGVYETPVAFSRLTPETVAVGLGLAAGLGLLAGAVAAGRLLLLDPLEEVEG